MFRKLPRLLFRRQFLAFTIVFWILSVSFGQKNQQPSQPPAALSPILEYIHSSWDTLTRSMSDCHTIVDPKLRETSILYIPARFAPPAPVKDAQKRCHLQVKELPPVITGPGQISNTISPPGLLFLENGYV